jgi:hypothetical protein
MKIKLIFKPISLKEANKYISQYHRHNKSVQGHKWSLGLYQGNKLIGVAITGRPVARLLDDGKTLEILRVCTNGYRNANSMLYSRVAKIARLMGYERIITYTLTKESGASLRAIGAEQEAKVKPTTWDRLNRKRKEQKVYAEEKIRWRL